MFLSKPFYFTVRKNITPLSPYIFFLLIDDIKTPYYTLFNFCRLLFCPASNNKLYKVKQRIIVIPILNNPLIPKHQEKHMESTFVNRKCILKNEYIHKRDVGRKIKVKEHRFALSLYKISTLCNKELGKRLKC